MTPLWLYSHDPHFKVMADAHFHQSLKATGMADKFSFLGRHTLCRYGDFGQPDYNASYQDCMESVIQDIHDNPGRLIVWSDVDLRFYRDFSAEVIQLADQHEFCCCMDSSDVRCTGFQFFKATEKMEMFFELWLETTRKGSYYSAQDSFNEVLKKGLIEVHNLPNTYWTAGLDMKAEWKEGMDVPTPPADIRLHHGNWTRGLDRKMALMYLAKLKHEHRT